MYDYHIHFYYGPKTRTIAKLLRNHLDDLLQGVAQVSLLHDKPPSPHSAPMFEVAFPKALLPKLTAWFKEHRAGHSVLLHPITGNEAEACLTQGHWMGKPLFYTKPNKSRISV